jgi:hypothetical protein
VDESGILDDQTANKGLLGIVVLEVDLELSTAAFRIDDRVCKTFSRGQLRRKKEPIRRG